MKLAIFGATGRTGSSLLDQALAAGHLVTALARDPMKLPVRERLRVIRGAAASPDAIAEAVQGADAVISAMAGGGNTLVTFGEHVIAAMTRGRVSRIVSLIGASVVEPGDPSSMGMAALRAITRLIASDVVKDGARHARQLEATDFAYTLVRPPRLTDGAATGRVNHGSALPLSPRSSIARADLAAFMLRVVVEQLYARAAPMVAQAT